MNNERKCYVNQRAVTSFMVLSIALIAFLTYKDILGYFFTGSDSLTLIDTSRIQSFRDIVRIFTRPLMHGTGFVELGRYYRPITALSYSLDYCIWRLNPFGYHLTDLILHVLVSVLVFFLIRFLTNGKQITAWLGAVIFTTHPILVESVPVTSRRQDIMAALFLLLSLLLFLKHLSASSRKRGRLLFSLLFYVLALGVKEIAIILPFLIFTYLMTFSFSTEESFKGRMVQSVKGSLPYLMMALIVFAWRIYVLQGLGGYVTTKMIVSPIKVIKGYFVDLLYPVDFLSLLFSPFPSILGQIASLIALLALFIFSLFYGRALLGIAGHSDRKVVRALIKVLLATIVASSLIGILAYPLISPYINQLIQQAYYGEGPRFLTDAMEGRHALPVEYYFYKARDLILKSLFPLLFFSTICLIGIHEGNKIKGFFNTARGKSVFFSLIWLSLPLGIYSLARTFDHRYMYISVIPFSVILSIMLVESVQSTIRGIMRRKSHSLDSSYRSSLISYAVIGFITAGLLVSLLAYSPLVRTYGEWEDSGKISSMFLHKLSEVVTELPNDAIIHVHNLPIRISSYKAKVPHARSVVYLRDYSIKSWLDLNHPNNRMEVVIHNRPRPAVCPSDLDLEVKREEDNDVVIVVRFDSSNDTQ